MPRKASKKAGKYVEAADNVPKLEYIKRFGHMPAFDKPVGWDDAGFRKVFKTKDLPFLKMDEFHYVKTSKPENQLIWGDNLAVMRSLPDECIDLIYIDPPFFSGRNYNLIFGDEDEVRTFSDIWDGGLPTYLAWMNARIWEMKRLLKSTGQIFVHLDWHASHYVKTEMDKIFTYGNFLNEIVWQYDGPQSPSKIRYASKHDVILRYGLTPKTKATDLYGVEKIHEASANYQQDNENRWFYHLPKGDYSNESIKALEKEGRIYRTRNGKIRIKYFVQKVGEYFLRPKKLPDVWSDITPISLKSTSAEKLGYQTQKPEDLIKRIIRTTTDKNDVVADFFMGGGTTLAVAEKLGRRWIGCDISRIAVSVTQDRLESIYSKKAGIEPKNDKRIWGFRVEYQGVYEKDKLRELSDEDHRRFMLQCYEASPKSIDTLIHGTKDGYAITVVPSRLQTTSDLVDEFMEELQQHGFETGIILAWKKTQAAEDRIQQLRRKGNGGPRIQLVQIKIVDIDSDEFKGENIRFLNKPAAIIKYKHVDGLTYEFDATASQGRNGVPIHYYQWDFNFKGHFSPMTKPDFKADVDQDGNPLNDNRKVTYAFTEPGTFKVALRIFDRQGASNQPGHLTKPEDMDVIEIAVGMEQKKAA